MMNLSRRELLKFGAAGLAASAVPGFLPADEKTPKDGFLEPAPCPPFDFKYPELGAVQPVASKRPSSLTAWFAARIGLR